MSSQIHAVVFFGAVLTDAEFYAIDKQAGVERLTANDVVERAGFDVELVGDCFDVARFCVVATGLARQATVDYYDPYVNIDDLVATDVAAHRVAVACFLRGFGIDPTGRVGWHVGPLCE